MPPENSSITIIPSEARLCLGPIRDFLWRWWLTSRQKELYLDSGEHVAFDTGCGVLADAEGRRLTVLDLSNSQEWLNRSLDDR